MVSNMKYMLKAKRWGLMRYLYDNCRKYGTTDQVIFFDSEKDVLNFFKFALEEDIADKTVSMDENRYTSGIAAFEAVMQIASCKIPFRELLKHNFRWFNASVASKLNSDSNYRSYWISMNLKSNPQNYKIFTITEKEIRGTKLQAIERFTWYKFYKKCLASGLTKEETTFNAE
jgi:hypothetical protein